MIGEGKARSTPQLNRIAGHRLEMENEQVRSYRVKLGPGEMIDLHTHAQPMLRVEITGGKVAISSRGRSREVVEVKSGEFRWKGESEIHSLQTSESQAMRR